MEKKKKAGQNILWFNEIFIGDVPLVGGKNASLGEMYSKLTKKGIRVPNGFAVSAQAYWDFLGKNGLHKKMKKELQGLDVSDVRALARVGKKVRDLILKSSFPKELEEEIARAYDALGKQTKKKKLSVAVRSSATAEDLPDASFAGQQETFLNVVGARDVVHAVKKCMASLFNNRAISYRAGRGFDHMSVALSVTVQEMVKADTGSSGVMFTMDTESGFRGVVLINASYGLGEYVVQGRVTPDQFYVFKEGVKQGKDAIIGRSIGTKEVKLMYGKTKGTRQMTVKQSDRSKFSITDKDVLQLARWALEIEAHYGKPQDIEWAKDGQTGELYIVQARPETVKTRKDHQVLETYRLRKKTGTVLLTGTAVGQKIGAGKVRIIESPKQLHTFKPGEILVTRITDPDWEPIMRIASAIITEQGGKTSHAAIVSRELGVPCIVGAHGARKTLKNGKPVTVSCADGDEGKIYKGILPFEVLHTEIKDIPKTKTKVQMIVGDPDNAFNFSFLPHEGVGLARLEFIFSNFIRIHPLALLHYNKLKDKRAKKKIRELTRGYHNKAEYCVDKLAEGIARIAVAMHPYPVVVRLSDFKTNEYATLIGGKEFEPHEENPMLGWRGASRYYSKEYKDAFGLECKAMKRVREEWGLENVVAMVPFCRTPEEGKKVLDTMKSYGLEQGKNGLKVYVMCEIPSNVILAEEFAKLFDGFSIGSNDLTQMMLGVDRDSSLVSHVYDENNKAVKKMIKEVIKVAHEHKRPVGICGQAPSDYPEFAEFLVRLGIDSISLNPDTVVVTKRRIAALEKTLGKYGKKTHKGYVSLVAALGLLSTFFIGAGAGCVETITGQRAPRATFEDVSPALIREKAMEKAQQAKEEEQKGARATIRETSFANFFLSYPAWWVVENWEGGITIRDEKTGEFVSVFEQLVSHPVSDTSKQPVEIAGAAGAVQFTDVLQDGSAVSVIEVPNDGGIIEINGRTEMFDEIIQSMRFEEAADGLSLGRTATHWDVREKRFCAQMITYAREGSAGACQAFPTPCDVPQNWQVCDADDVE